MTKEANGPEEMQQWIDRAMKAEDRLGLLHAIAVEYKAVRDKSQELLDINNAASRSSIGSAGRGYQTPPHVIDFVFAANRKARQLSDLIVAVLELEGT